MLMVTSVSQVDWTKCFRLKFHNKSKCKSTTYCKFQLKPTIFLEVSNRVVVIVNESFLTAKMPKCDLITPFFGPNKLTIFLIVSWGKWTDCQLISLAWWKTIVNQNINWLHGIEQNYQLVCQQWNCYLQPFTSCSHQLTDGGNWIWLWHDYWRQCFWVWVILKYT